MALDDKGKAWKLKMGIRSRVRAHSSTRVAPIGYESNDAIYQSS
jgi:hypothetical protein